MWKLIKFAWHQMKKIMTNFFVLDNNECNTLIHGCEQKCLNNHGNYTCACFSGYQLNSDQRTCSGKT